MASSAPMSVSGSGARSECCQKNAYVPRPITCRALGALERQGGGLVEHGDQRVGVVREAAEEQAVDGVAELGEQAGAGRAAVDHDAAGAVGVGVERSAQRAG